MNHSADGINRVLLGVIGLALVGTGAYGLARGAGAFGMAGDEPLLTSGLRRFTADNSGWFWWVAAGLALAGAGAGLAWIRTQFRAAAPAALPPYRSARGVTRVRPEAATAALVHDVERSEWVNSASARWADRDDYPHLDLRVEVADACDLGEARRHLEDVVLPRFRHALDQEDLVVRLDFELAPARARALR